MKNFMRKFVNPVTATIMGVGTIISLAALISVAVLAECFGIYYDFFAVIVLTVAAFELFGLFYIVCATYDSIATNREETNEAWNAVVELYGEEVVALKKDRKSLEAFLEDKIACLDKSLDTIWSQRDAEPALEGERLQEVEQKEDNIYRARHVVNEMLYHSNHLKYIK